MGVGVKGMLILIQVVACFTDNQVSFFDGPDLNMFTLADWQHIQHHGYAA